MAYRKVTIDITIRMTLVADEGESIDDILNEMDYSFTDTTGNAEVEDHRWERYDIIDSK